MVALGASVLLSRRLLEAPLYDGIDLMVMELRRAYIRGECR